MLPAETSPAAAASAVRSEALSSPSILICRPNTRLGNTLLLTPLVEELQSALPNARIEILTACPAAQEVFQEFPGVYRVHALPLRGVRHPLHYLRTLLRVRRTRYDIIIDPCPNSWTARFLTRRLAGRLKIGFAAPRRQQGLDVSIPFEGAPRHMGAYPVYLARRALFNLDPRSSRADEVTLSVRLTDAERAQGRETLRRLLGEPAGGPVIALATHATGAKRFSVEWWRRMIAEVRTRLPAARFIEIRPPSGYASLAELPGFASRRTRQVAALIESAACFVCADSGLMHLGAATDALTVGLFKVTLPELYAPRRGRSCALSASDAAPEAVGARLAELIE
ncbi:MAG: glycosyltransferase family 9 protein [Steroidobacteraceae bacterium]